MSWDRFLSAGDAYAREKLLSAEGFDAAWSMLFPADATAWMRRVTSRGALGEMARQWGNVWWNYLCARVGVPPSQLTTPEALCVIHLGCDALRTSARVRSVFLAVMFQLVVTERHDQMLCSIDGDPVSPPFYSNYVSRSKLGSTFSLRTLMACESEYACAKRTVDRFRGVKGRVVAEIYAPCGAELIRLGRTKLKRFKCARCSASRPRPGCKKCTRLQEHNPEGVVSYFDERRTYTPVKDVQTVCGDVVFVTAKRLQRGDVVLEHTKDGDRKLFLETKVFTTSKTLMLNLRDATTGAKSVWQRPAKSMVPVMPCHPDTVQMMTDNAEVVHGMGVSVHPDKVCESWSLPAQRFYRAATSPVQLKCLKGAHLIEYAVWRSLAGLVKHLLPKRTPLHVRKAMNISDTHCLHHKNHAFVRR